MSEVGSNRTRVLFVCTHNSARSQMAEGLLRHLAGDRFEVFSAGTEARGVHPLAVRAMADAGIDITGQRSETADRYVDPPMDVVVTVCDSAREACPWVPALRERVHQSFEDPSAVDGSEEERLAAFIRVREQIRAWLSDTFL